MQNHMYIWFYMVVEKWFAPCGKCEENWGHWAWVIGQLSLRGMEVLPSSAWTQTFVYFPDRGAERHKKGENGGQKCSLRPLRGYKQWFWSSILAIKVIIEMMFGHFFEICTMHEKMPKELSGALLSTYDEICSAVAQAFVFLQNHILLKYVGVFFWFVCLHCTKCRKMF